MTAVADKALRTTAVEADTVCGKAVGVNIAGPRTASGTTTDYPGQVGKVNGRMSGGTGVDSQNLDKTEWTDTQNG